MRAPLSTYRLQLHANFTFADAAEQVPYLARLGVSHLYLSPVLQAAPGSTHGYDVVDHSRLSDDLGGDEGFAVLLEAAQAHGLAMIADVVPNHVSVTPPQDLNPAWWGLLRDGAHGRYGHWFDVDWDAQRGKVLVPVLGDDLDAVRGEITLDSTGAEAVLRYHDHVFPVRPGTEDLPLADLLDVQHYRLASWREAAEGLNYRRFFDVTTLAAVRVESPEVFAATHEVLISLMRTGGLEGLRIDHPDGLAHPGRYLQDLAVATGNAYVVVEKILEGDEELPADWATAGTTGYETLNTLLGLLVDPAGEAPLTDLYAELTGVTATPAEAIDAGKRLVVRSVLGSEVARLAREADLDADGRAALVELLVAMPAYRAYVSPHEPARPQDLAHLDHATAAAKTARPDLAGAIDEVRALVQHGPPGVVTRFQQTCGPVMAKGIEDTAFYRHHRLTGLNEVGADLTHFGVSVAEAHLRAARQQERHPLGMTTLSTHDTKRSEDVRARLVVLSEVPAAWAETARTLERLGERHRSASDTPGANDRYLMWQTLLGAWPITADRAVGYALKAAREAKQRTAWVDGDDDYDAALVAWVRAVLADPEITGALEAFLDTIADAALSNSLAQKLLQLTWPGVPDLYQGTEFLDLSLVDPDNRRPVDYAARAASLATAEDPKQHVVTEALRLRRDRPETFRGSYTPMLADGPAAHHVVASARGDDQGVVTIATRLPARLVDAGGWRGTTLTLPGEGPWTDLLTGLSHDSGTVTLDDLLDVRAVALLVRDSSAS